MGQPAAVLVVFWKYTANEEWHCIPCVLCRIWSQFDYNDNDTLPLVAMTRIHSIVCLMRQVDAGQVEIRLESREFEGLAIGIHK